jgi:malate synthase
VAHPDLVPVAREVFARVLLDHAHQKERLRQDVAVNAAELLDVRVDGAQVTEAGVRNNISVGLQYVSAWLRGNGAVAIFNLMEDAATAEIARAQLWQWIHHGARLGDGRPVTPALYHALEAEEIGKLSDVLPAAVEILDGLVLDAEFAEFLTPLAYRRLE